MHALKVSEKDILVSLEKIESIRLAAVRYLYRGHLAVVACRLEHLRSLDPPLQRATIRLSLEYLNSLRQHAVQLNEADLAALAHSAVGLKHRSPRSEREKGHEDRNKSTNGFMTLLITLPEAGNLSLPIAPASLRYSKQGRKN